MRPGQISSSLPAVAGHLYWVTRMGVCEGSVSIRPYVAYYEWRLLTKAILSHRRVLSGKLDVIKQADCFRNPNANFVKDLSKKAVSEASA